MPMEAIHEKIGQLHGEMIGLREIVAAEAKRNRDLLQTGVIDRLADHIDHDLRKFSDIELRLRTVEAGHLEYKSIARGGSASSTKWATAVSACVTVAINIGVAVYSKLAH